MISEIKQNRAMLVLFQERNSEIKFNVCYAKNTCYDTLLNRLAIFHFFILWHLETGHIYVTHLGYLINKNNINKIYNSTLNDEQNSRINVA